MHEGEGFHAQANSYALIASEARAPYSRSARQQQKGHSDRLVSPWIDLPAGPSGRSSVVTGLVLDYRSVTKYVLRAIPLLDAGVRDPRSVSRPTRGQPQKRKPHPRSVRLPP